MHRTGLTPPVHRPLLFGFLAAALAGSASAQVTFDWVTIGNPGNAADTTGYGAVGQSYRLSRTEVTNAQYAEFLNAVAATDNPNTIWFPSMNIVRTLESAAPLTFSYAPVSGRENEPAVAVGVYGALRFANWLHNGQPDGEYLTTTSDGAYTDPTSDAVTRNAGARFFVPSIDEWYKAAFYDPNSGTYNDYPYGSDTATACVAPAGDTGNSANCDAVVGDAVDVGSYPLSETPYGLLDMGGNANEWCETPNPAINPGWFWLRGGGFDSASNWMSSTLISAGGAGLAGTVSSGFRVGSPVPGDPGTPFCFGVSCPCANDAAASGCVNSSGLGAILTASGTDSVVADDLVLTISNIPSPNANGIVFMGPSMLAPFLPASADGFACTGGGLRFPGLLDDGVAPNELVQTQVVSAAAAGGVPISSGETWHFQGWFRDNNGSPCGGSSNLSNATSITFSP